MSLGEPWFRPRESGYGFTPINAKGIAATVAFILIAIATTLLLAAPGASRPPEVGAWLAHLRAGLGLGSVSLPVVGRIAVIGAEAAIFLVFAWSKSRPPKRLD